MLRKKGRTVASYTGMTPNTDRDFQHLGGNIIEGDAFTFSPTAWNYVVDRFAVRSVLDLGSGIGYAAEYLHRKGLKVLAVDGLASNVRAAIYPTIELDLTKSAVKCVVDFVHCQEVVEHISEEFLENLLASLCCGRFLLMTHAVPGQGGYHHVNEQPAEYWISHLGRYGFRLMEEDTQRVRKMATDDGAIYLARTGMLFVNSAKIVG